jgi:hypothetical protein
MDPSLCKHLRYLKTKGIFGLGLGSKRDSLSDLSGKGMSTSLPWAKKWHGSRGATKYRSTPFGNSVVLFLKRFFSSSI